MLRISVLTSVTLGGADDREGTSSVESTGSRDLWQWAVK